MRLTFAVSRFGVMIYLNGIQVDSWQTMEYAITEMMPLIQADTIVRVVAIP